MAFTAEWLREWVRYNKKTGVMTWRKHRGSRARAGETIGTLCKKGYLSVEINGRHYKVHVLAWLYVKGVWPDDQIDHRDLNGSNNAWKNLRPCDTRQNCAGRGVRKDNVTGFKGVSQVSPGVWRSRIRVNYAGIHLGRFDCPKKAAREYDSAATRHFGEFARTNASMGLL